MFNIKCRSAKVLIFFVIYFPLIFVLFYLDYRYNRYQECHIILRPVSWMCYKGKSIISIYSKGDEFTFPIVNLPFLSSNMPINHIIFGLCCQLVYLLFLINLYSHNGIQTRQLMYNYRAYSNNKVLFFKQETIFCLSN